MFICENFGIIMLIFFPFLSQALMTNIRDAQFEYLCIGQYSMQWT